jgi:hypothetical protein
VGYQNKCFRTSKIDSVVGIHKSWSRQKIPNLANNYFRHSPEIIDANWSELKYASLDHIFYIWVSDIVACICELVQLRHSLSLTHSYSGREMGERERHINILCNKLEHAAHHCHLLSDGICVCVPRVGSEPYMYIHARARINQTACSYIYFGRSQCEGASLILAAAAFALINPHRLQLIEVTPRARYRESGARKRIKPSLI